MGGPSYEKPYPVKRSDGSQIIWDWGKREWVPYTEQGSPTKQSEGPPPGERTEGDAPGSSGAQSSGSSAADAPSGVSGPSQDAGPSLHQKPRRRRRSGGMIRGPQPAMLGTSLLSAANRFGEY